MVTRSDEIKGRLKEGLGKVTRNKGLEAEGILQREHGHYRRRVSGAWKEARGTVKVAIGTALHSPTLKAEGEADRLVGRAERA